MKKRTILFLSVAVMFLVSSRVAAIAADILQARQAVVKIEEERAGALLGADMDTLDQIPAYDFSQAVAKVEEERIGALLGSDMHTLDQILAYDFIYTDWSGLIHSKAEYLADIKSGKLAYKSMKHDGVRVKVMYGRSAVLTGRADLKVTEGGQDLDLSVRFTEVYTNRDGQWYMVASQDTRIPK